MRVMILGKPGVGKSQLAEHLIRCTGAGKWSVSKFNGTLFRIDNVEEIQRQFRMRDMFGGYRALWIEEADKVPAVAQVTMLTLLDDLPDNTLAVLTSNTKLSEFEIRFQRRYEVCDVAGPTQPEIAAFIRKHWPEIPKQRVDQISTFACGNVGQALMDTQTAYVESAAELAA